MRRFKLPMVATLLFATSIFADVESGYSQNEISNANVDSNLKSETILDWVRDFENRFGITMGLAKDGKTFFFGQAPVRVGPLDIAYGKELTIAYEKAVLNLQANFILQTYGREVTERISDFFENDSTNAREFEPVKLQQQVQEGKIGVILDKFLDVVDKKLNSMLSQQGVPESEIQKMSVEQKKMVFRDNFRKSIVKKATQNMSGLVPIQTKVLTQKTPVGDAVTVGVIAVMSDKTVQFARDIARGRDTLVRGRAGSVKDILPQTQKEYLNEFGLRYMYDEDGRPMLLSYGRWSIVGKTQNPSKYLRKVQSAKDKARMFAESYIGEFMKSNIQASASLDADSVNEEIAKKISEIEYNRVSNENESVDDIGETIDTSFQKVKANSTFKLRGTSEVRSWEERDENGILHVGSVISWTYKQLENANSIAGDIKPKPKPKVEIVQEVKKAKDESKTSKIINDIDDF